MSSQIFDSLIKRLWISGSFLFWIVFTFIFPLYSPFFAVPFLVALTFHMNELQSLFIAAALGFILDLFNTAYPFGFYTLTAPALVAFLFSLEHFFHRTQTFAIIASALISIIISLTSLISSAFFAREALFSFHLLSHLAALPLICSLVTLGLIQAESLLAKKA